MSRSSLSTSIGRWSTRPDQRVDLARVGRLGEPLEGRLQLRERRLQRRDQRGRPPYRLLGPQDEVVGVAPRRLDPGDERVHGRQQSLRVVEQLAHPGRGGQRHLERLLAPLDEGEQLARTGDRGQAHGTTLALRQAVVPRPAGQGAAMTDHTASTDLTA